MNLRSFRSIKALLKFYLLFAFTLGAILEANAVAEKKMGTGLIPLTTEQAQHIEKHWPKIVHVKPNKIGATRINEHIKKHGHSSQEIKVFALHHEEIITNKDTKKLASLKTQKLADTPLPRYVDNSTRPSFPPIGNQGNQGSCVAWASTYYQTTHEIGLLNGTNNKSGFANVLSPKWTYNLLNGGQDGGLMILDAYTLLSKNGASSLANFPYDGNYLSWDTNPQDWISAISYRTTDAHLVSGLGGDSPQNLQVIKQLLANGHVLTIGTFIESWVFTSVGNDPANPNSPFVGQLAASWMNGTLGGHCMTIVGYNDDIWIDVNENGKVDPGEKGAFLIANSWGTDWGNDGFVWISYDAFLSTSAVPGGPNDGRVAAGEALNSHAVSVLPKAANYQPSLISQFSLSQSIRDQIGISAGMSDTTQITPVDTFTSGALAYQGGRYEFDGKVPGAPETATFAVDLSDLVTSIDGVNALKRFYLMLSDSTAKHPTTLNSLTLIDTVHQKNLSYSSVPIVCDNSEVTPYIDYNFYGQANLDNVPPVVNITSPAEGQTLEGTVEVVINATDDVAVDRVELYVDSELYATDTTVPYLISVDTTELSNGVHQLTAIAYDTSNNSSQSVINVQVNNSTSQFTLFVNAGGDTVTSQGNTWQKDSGYTKSFSANISNISFDNPVYNTERYGNFSYNFAVPNGSYTVKLKFAELYYHKPNKRVFNVAINSQKVVSKLDLFKVAGFGKPYDLTFPVKVINKQIKIDFTSIRDYATVCAIEITGT